MRLFLDTDILLDVLLEREAFLEASAALLFGAQIIVTRNLADYRRSPIKALRPVDLSL